MGLPADDLEHEGECETHKVGDSAQSSGRSLRGPGVALMGITRYRCVVVCSAACGDRGNVAGLD